jgi:hypothetical protein
MHKIASLSGPIASTVAMCRVFVLALLVTGTLASHSVADAATFYLSPTGSDVNPGTEAQPWATFARAWQSLRRGDTLILLDGVYYQGMVTQAPAVDPANPQYITIKAKNDGKAIIDGRGAGSPLMDVRGTHLIFEGFVVGNAATAVFRIQGSNHVLRRISAYNASVDLNSSVIAIAGASDVLLEDVVAAGTGRKMVVITRGARNTLRRVFSFWQRWDGREFCGINWPHGAGLEIYDTSNHLIENSISYGNVPSYHIGFKSQNNTEQSQAVDNRLMGNIAINAGKTHPDGATLHWPESERPQPTNCTGYNDPNYYYSMRSGFWVAGAGVVRDNLLQDNLSYGNANVGFVYYNVGRTGYDGQPATSGNVIRRFTAMANGSDNPNGPWPGIWGGKDIDVTQTDLDAFGTVEDSRIERIFQSWPNYPNGTKVVTSLTGGGARLRYRYVDGVLMDGTNGRAEQSLWPWPMEQRIQSELGISVTNLVAGIVPDQVAPTTSCISGVAPSTVSFSATGGSTTLAVSAADSSCGWTAIPGAPWIVPSPESGNGGSSIELYAEPNTSQAPRSASVSIAGRTVTVHQAAEAVACTYTVSPQMLSAPAHGGTTGVTIGTSPGCEWSAASFVPWVSVSPTSGDGGGSTAVTVASNDSEMSRTTSISIGGQSVRIDQAGRVQTGTLSIRNLQSATDVPRFGKFELTFDVANSSATAPQWPYDPAPPPGVPAGVGISVDAIFTDPDGREHRQPAFYSQDFLDETRGGRDWHLPTGHFSWRVRFSPHKTGPWSYRLVVRDSSGTVETPAYALQVLPSSNRGFVKVSAADSRYFEFDDGSLFNGMGFQFAGHLDDPAAKGGPEYQKLGDYGVNFVRLWISSMFGSAWTPYVGGRNLYAGYLPRTGLVPYLDANTGQTTLTLRIDYESAGDTGWFDACRLQWWNDPESVKPQTTYRLRVRYRGSEITGPRNSGYPNYGFVAKLGGWFPSCHEPGTSTVITNYGLDNDGWSYIEGTWHSGNQSFLPRLHLALENVRQGVVHVQSVSLREDLGNGNLGPEMMIKPSMEHHLYIPEEKAYAFDKIVQHAERNGVYLKLVVMEKNDKIWLKMANSGDWATTDNGAGFYGTGRTVNKTRWLQQMWWRYLQARWGYSPNIHSWELTNEGDPARVGHYELADEFGKYMHCRVFGVEPGSGDGVKCPLNHPNAHMVTTSFWHSFPAAAFWSNAKYPNVDYADLHAYVSTSFAPLADKELMKWDAAYYRTWHSGHVGGLRIGKPTVRGEAGLDAPNQQNETVLGLQRDTSGVWLHNYLWSGLHSGGMYELYWWNSHVWNANADHRGKYRAIANFLQDVPLNKGGFVDWGGSVSDAGLRVVGQKNTASGTLHLWVQNKQHTWKNVVDGADIPSVSGEIVVPGFAAGSSYSLERWDTGGGALSSHDSLTADTDGTLRIPISSLRTDIALKVRLHGPVSSSPAPPTGLRLVTH